MIITGKKFSKPELSRVINGDKVFDEPEKPEKFRLDKKLVEKYPEYNRNTLQTFIKSGYVTVDGKPALKPNTEVEENANIKLTLPRELTDESLKKQAIENMRPEKIYENDYVLVVNKPAGLLSMSKGEYCAEPTLEDYGLLVHRLDRDTSGVVILAKDETTQKMLRKQFQERTAHKTYLAVVEGRPKLDSAMIDLPISRNMKHPTTFLVDANGKPSQTYYKVLKSNDRYSLLELKPTTGRTHQLRVHLKYLGTPILGDRVYGTAKPDTDMRLYLHAKELEITIPDIEVPKTTADPDLANALSFESKPVNRRMTFSAPTPEEFNEIFEN